MHFVTMKHMFGMKPIEQECSHSLWQRVNMSKGCDYLFDKDNRHLPHIPGSYVGRTMNIFCLAADMNSIVLLHNFSDKKTINPEKQ